MKSDNHYEVAFDAYLRERGAAVVPVVEARRSYLDANEVKSPDFIVIGPRAAKLVVDVKGRLFAGPGKSGKARYTWQNWCEREDVISLALWTERFGADFCGVLAFVYHLGPYVEMAPGTPDLFAFRSRIYLMRGVLVTDYRRHMRTRSPRWGTVHLATDDFRQLVKPIAHFLAPPAAGVELESARV
jgi:hypothetical protein